MFVANLQEPQRVDLGQKDVFRRRKGLLQPSSSNDEACYISVLDSLKQLLNDEFVLNQVKCKSTIFFPSSPAT